MNSIIEIAAAVSENVKGMLSEQATLSEIEETTRQLMQDVGRHTVAMTASEMAPRSPARTITCGCGEKAAYLRQRPADFHTIYGKLKIKRAYYLCSSCHQGTYPLDDALGLRPNALSAKLSRLVAQVGVQLPFAKARDLLEALTLVSVSDQAIRKATLQMGHLVAAAEHKQQDQARDSEFLRQRAREAKRPLRLYGTIDATKVHICDDAGYRWRDLKIGAWFEAQAQAPRSPNDPWTIRAKHIDYDADICSADTFGALFWSSGVARDAQLARELIIIADGADWIWNLVQTHFPKAVQILDWFHACEYLMPLAQAAFAAEPQQTDWVKHMKDLMWAGQIDDLIAACRALSEHCDSDLIRTTANYFENHKYRMRYAYFREQGYQIGSGTIESAAKQIGTSRMKIPGATWNLANAPAMAKARAAFLSDRWPSLPLAA